MEEQLSTQELVEALVGVPQAVQKIAQSTDDRFAHAYGVMAKMSEAMRVLAVQNADLAQRVEELEGKAP